MPAPAPDLAAVLEVVNKGRAALRLQPLTELPKARPADPCGCVIARSFNGAEVDGHTMTNPRDQQWSYRLYEAWGRVNDESSHTIGLPQILRNFIKAFDAGDYPHLIDLPMKREEFRVRPGLCSPKFVWRHYKPDDPESWDIVSHEFDTREEAQADLERFFASAGI